MPPLHYLPVGIFAVVYVLIALRNFRRFKIPIWTIMLAGAVAMIFSGAIPLQDAYAAINLDVIFFLLGMFSIVAAMELSGFLEYLTARMIRLAKTPQRALALVLFGMGLLSAFLVNDTLALTATPIMLGLSKQMRIKPSVLLMTLALGVTIGSAMTPVGNPPELAHRLVQWDSKSDARLSLLSSPTDNDRVSRHISHSQILLSKGSCKIR